MPLPCQEQAQASVVPAPFLLEHLDDEQRLWLSDDALITYCPDSLFGVACQLRDGLAEAAGLELALAPSRSPAPGGLHLALRGDIWELEGLPHREEGYVCLVTEQGARLAAHAPAGLVHATQTLLQLLPPAGAGAGGESGSGGGAVVLPGVRVIDAPRFAWRGLLLDTARHFFPPAFLRRTLDLMAAYKLNRLHWHLVDDQGWRLEVPALPELTAVGAWRRAEGAGGAGGDAPGEGDGGGGGGGGPPGYYGGYYSLEEVAGIVAYASERGITVVPEIEMPGHCIAALASYPNLSCFGDVREVSTEWGVHPESAFCAGQEETFDFVEEVLGEALRQFPSEAIHLGGDEVVKAQWRRCARCQGRREREGLPDEDSLQAWFMARAGAFLSARGRRMVAWDEILEGGAAPEGAVVMAWRGAAAGAAAAAAGHDVVMAPTSHCYLDHRQGEGEGEPGVPGTCLTLETVYSFDPVAPEEEEHPAGRAPAHGTAAAAAAAAAAAGREGEEGSEEDYVMVSWPGGGEGGDAAEAACRRGQPCHSAPPAEEERRGCGGACGLAPEAEARILGGQACLWTEYVATPAAAEYMLLPRLCAMAEALWSRREPRDWHDFRRRAAAHEAGWRRRGYNFRPLDP